MTNRFVRLEMIAGSGAVEIMKHCRIAVFGIGGVGGYVCEALVRSGVGAFDRIDDDQVCLTNLNRQIIATRKTVGQYKAEVMRDKHGKSAYLRSLEAKRGIRQRRFCARNTLMRP